jgi:uracil-DNA glycosylase
MIVGNNFSTIKGWSDYSNSPDVDSMVKTWKRLRLMIEASGVPAEAFWFTNYCLGAMEAKEESYDFPRSINKALEFERVFAECLIAMKPRLVVTLGRPISDILKTGYDLRERIDTRTFAGHTARFMAAVHPSAWAWQKKGFGDKEFVAEGARIGAAARAALHRP